MESLSSEQFNASSFNSCKKFGDIATFYKSFGDETRLRLLWELTKAELCVSDLASSLSMSNSNVSHQLKELKAVKLVNTRRDGKFIYYSIFNSETISLLEQFMKQLGHSSTS
jgi:Predicted transcriptional regulators